MSYNYFNPTTANQIAKFQGTFTGIQAGNAPYIGTAAAPTSIYNQAGYYAIQDPQTGYVNLQRLGNESMYTGQWYDQTTGVNFNISTAAQTTNAVQNTNATNPYNINIQITGGSQATQPAFTGGYQQQPAGYTQYPWGAGTVVVNSSYGQDDYNSGYQAGYNAGYQNATNGVNGTQTTGTTQTTSTTTQTTDAANKDPQKELKTSDLQDMVDCGIYESLEDAYNDLSKKGYWLSDNEQAKLGMYDEADEEKIKTLMDKLGCTREEAIQQLGSKIETTGTKNDKDALEEKINSMMDNGLSRKEAVEYLEELGYEVPDELKKEPAKFSDEDEAKIKAVMEATGCSRDEAIKATGVKPKQDGLITKMGKGIGNFFKGIGQGIKQGWNDFWEWLL